MIELNFPKYQFRLSKDTSHHYIFDEVRKKKIVLTPEEWVRQHAIRFLKEEKSYPHSLMKVERQLKLNGLTKRFDLVCFDTCGAPLLLAEFKQPNIEITQATFDQAARYNFIVHAPYVWVTNGLSHYMAEVDFEEEKVNFIKEIPPFSGL